MDQGTAVAALAALANETRLALVRQLVAAGEGGLAQGVLARTLSASPSRLAFHLDLLERGGLVRARREGRNVFYAANGAGLGALVAYILDDCCSADPGVRACCAPGRPLSRPPEA